MRNTQLKDIKNLYSNAVVFGNAMIGWNYRLFVEDANTCSVGEGCDYVADKMHDAADREVILILDELLAERGAARKRGIRTKVLRCGISSGNLPRTISR